MTIAEIKLRPECFITNYPQVLFKNDKKLRTVIYTEGKCHESLLRAYHILDKTKEWLRSGTPPTVVLEMIEDIENAEGVAPYKREDDNPWPPATV